MTNPNPNILQHAAFVHSVLYVYMQPEKKIFELNVLDQIHKMNS